jgi:multisubunit Na+/H+ antiporter MnhE subunit
MIHKLIFPVPFAITWVLLTNQAGLFSFALGYVLAFLISQLIIIEGEHTRSIKLPWGVLLLFRYVLGLVWDAFLSGVDVFLRAVNIRSIDHAGIIAVDLHIDPEDDEAFENIVAGLSAHGITITPGELLVHYDRDEQKLYVHCLDMRQSLRTIDAKQIARVEKYRRILGRDD